VLGSATLRAPQSRCTTTCRGGRAPVEMCRNVRVETIPAMLKNARSARNPTSTERGGRRAGVQSGRRVSRRTHTTQQQAISGSGGDEPREVHGDRELRAGARPPAALAPRGIDLRVGGLGGSGRHPESFRT
jgi:hypothetical protein